MCVCLHDNSKSSLSRNMKFGHIVVQVRYWALSDQGQGHCATSKFSPFTAIQTVRSLNSTLVQVRKIILRESVKVDSVIVRKIILRESVKS